jgi:hypothetical protein
VKAEWYDFRKFSIGSGLRQWCTSVFNTSTTLISFDFLVRVLPVSASKLFLLRIISHHSKFARGIKKLRAWVGDFTISLLAEFI